MIHSLLLRKDYQERLFQLNSVFQRMTIIVKLLFLNLLTMEWHLGLVECALSGLLLLHLRSGRSQQRQLLD